MATRSDKNSDDGKRSVVTEDTDICDAETTCSEGFDDRMSTERLREEERKRRRRVSNRIAAQQSRKRQKLLIEELRTENDELGLQRDALLEENRRLTREILDSQQNQDLGRISAEYKASSDQPQMVRGLQAHHLNSEAAFSTALAGTGPSNAMATLLSDLNSPSRNIRSEPFAPLIARASLGLGGVNPNAISSLLGPSRALNATQDLAATLLTSTNVAHEAQNLNRARLDRRAIENTVLEEPSSSALMSSLRAQQHQDQTTRTVRDVAAAQQMINTVNASSALSRAAYANALAESTSQPSSRYSSVGNNQNPSVKRRKS